MVRKVTARERCPICGKPDWCFWIPVTKWNGELLCCQRHMTGEDVLGLDGNFYVHHKFSDSDGSKGKSIFEEATQRRMRLSALKKENEAVYEFKKAKTVQKTLTPVNIIQPKENKELNKIYRAMLKMLTLEPEHRKYLHKEGWTDELIEKNMVRSFPEKDFTRFKHRKESFKDGNISRKKLAAQLIEMFGKDALIGVPGAFQDKGGNWTFSGRSGILFPQYDVYHQIYRLRLRMDFRDVDACIVSSNDGDDYFKDQYGKEWFLSMGGIYEIVDDIVDGKKRVYQKGSGKYRNFSSYKENEDAAKQGFLMNTYAFGCEAGNQLGFYYNESMDDMYICYITEGEKKGIYSNDKLRAPFVSVPGVSSWAFLFSKKNGIRPIDVLKTKGVKVIIVAFDADRATNEAVMCAQNSTIDALKKEGFMVGIAEWNMNLGKGIDDLLASGYRPEFALA